MEVVDTVEPGNMLAVYSYGVDQILRQPCYPRVDSLHYPQLSPEYAVPEFCLHMRTCFQHTFEGFP